MPSEPPRLRLFFDPGAGTCLWAGDAAARERFGYAVELEELPVDDALIARLQALVQRYDASLDWSDPGAGPTGSEAERAALEAEADRVLVELRAAVADRLVVVDERGS